jgi:hypothetical protein
MAYLTGDVAQAIAEVPESERQCSLVASLRRIRCLFPQVLPSDDPLDRPEFDPIAYINQSFPTEVGQMRRPVRLCAFRLRGRRSR